MVGFGELVWAMKLGMGLVSGFTAQAEKEREANEAKQLKLLQLLKDDEHELIELPSSQIRAQGNVLDALFGTGQARVGATDEPAIMVGNRGFVRRKYGMMGESNQLGDILKNLGVVAQPQVAPQTEAPATPAPSRPFAPVAPATPAAPTPVQTSTAAPIDTFVVQTATKNNVNPALALAIKGVEGSGPSAVSPKGAIGLFQIKPDTAAPYGVTAEQLTDPRVNVTTGIRHIADLSAQYPDRPDLVAAAYFSGSGNVRDGQIVNPHLSDGTLTVQQYVDRTMQRIQSFAKKAPAAQQEQRIAQAGEPSVIDIPQQVASRAAPSVQAAPTFDEIPLPKARTEKDYIFEEQRSAAENLAPRLRKNAKGDLVMGKALETAADQGRKRFTQDRERVRKDADRMKKERQIHSY